MTLAEAITSLPTLTESEVAEINTVGFDANHTEGFDILEHFIRKNRNDIVERALDGGIDVNIQNKYGWTLLHVAIRYGNMDMMRHLTEEKSADIDRVDGVGWTPLMESIIDDMAEACGYLVEKGADKNISNQRGATAGMLAMKFGRTNMSQYF